MRHTVDLTHLTRSNESDDCYANIDIQLPDGNTICLWVAHLPDHTSVDVWRTRGRDEPISDRTGDKTRAPVGVMGWRNGSRLHLPEDLCPPVDGESHEWPALSTVTLLWDKEP